MSYVYWVSDEQPGIELTLHRLSLIDAINMATRRAWGTTGDHGGDLLLGRDVFYLVSRLPGWIASRDPSDLYFDPACVGVFRLKVGRLNTRFDVSVDLSVVHDGFIVQTPHGSCSGRVMSRAVAMALLQGKDPGVFGVIEA